MKKYQETKEKEIEAPNIPMCGDCGQLMIEVGEIKGIWVKFYQCPDCKTVGIA